MAVATLFSVDALARAASHHFALDYGGNDEHTLAIADAIVQSHPDIVATQPELIARHYTEGRADALALPYWMKAGGNCPGLSRLKRFLVTADFSRQVTRVPIQESGDRRITHRADSG